MFQGQMLNFHRTWPDIPRSPSCSLRGVLVPQNILPVRWQLVATSEVGGGNYDIGRGIFNEKVYSNYKGGMLEAPMSLP